MTPSFDIGDKIEAVDKKNNMMVCVATITDAYGDQLLVHFDGWEDSYDYWCDSTSPYIHPVGWCQDNCQILSAPNGYPDATKFTWEQYFIETNSKSAAKNNFGQVSDEKLYYYYCIPQDYLIYRAQGCKLNVS